MKMTLKAARINAGLTQKQVAQTLNISNKTLCSWENGKRSPDVLRASELCRIYGVVLDDINFLPE